MQHRDACGSLHAAGDGRDQHDLVAVLEGVRVAAEEADVLVIHVDIDKTTEFPLLVLDLGGECREVLVNIFDERGEIRGFAAELLLAFGVADEGGGKDDLDGDGSTP